MSAKKIPITPVFLDLPTVAQAVALSTATIERLEREVQEWAESRPVSNLPPPPNTGASKRKEAA
jgi:prophage regulatory protein